MIALLKSYLPQRNTVILITVGFIIGMIWAYGVFPVQYVNGEPAQLEQSWQDQWVLGLAARWENRNADNSTDIRNLLGSIDEPVAVVNQLDITDSQFNQLAQEAQAQAPPTPPQPGIINNVVLPILSVVIFAVVFVILFILWELLIWPFIEPIYARMTLGRGKDAAANTAAAAQIEKIKADKAQQAAMLEQKVESNQYGDPVIRKLSNYKEGFGNYDDSFNIETDAGLYYGECGASIAEKIGDGVTAIEVWMFDKDEFTNTPTAIFATEHAATDPAIRSRLEPRGELVTLQPGIKVVLETAALYVEAIVRDVQYDSDPSKPPQSTLSSASIEIIAWAKAGGGGATTPAAPAMPQAQPAMPDFPSSAPTQPVNPPSQTPSTPSPFGPPGGGPPTSPPPPAQPPGGSNEPEDPFGGTGDFTPIR